MQALPSFTAVFLLSTEFGNEAALTYVHCVLLRLIYRLEQDKRICHREVELKSGEHSQLVRAL